MKKRVLSCFMALVMMLSLLPMSVLAAPIDSKGTENNPVTASANGVTVNKYVSGREGNYQLTLEAYASNQLTTTTTTTPLDIVLVLDVSGSMNDTFVDAITEYNPVYQLDTNKRYYIKAPNGRYRSVDYRTFLVDDGWYYSESWNLIRVTPKTSEDDPDQSHVQFYTAVTTAAKSKMKALQEAVGAFVGKVDEKNQAIKNVDDKHRISVVKFADGSYATRIGNDKNGSYNKTQVVKDFTYKASELTTAVNALSPGGATAADYGLTLAEGVINGEFNSLSLTGAREKAKKVVVFFTDGEPNHKNGFSSTVAENTIQKAKSLKNVGATIYSVGVFEDETTQIENYMEGVSSNFPNATGYQENNLGDRVSSDYYSVATNADGLNKVFEGIANDVTTGTLTANPDSTAVLSDTLSQYFTFPTEFDGSKAEVKFAEAKTYDSATGFTFKAPGELPKDTSATVSVEGNTIKVTGFDYKANAAAYNATTQEVTGGKLVVTFPIEANVKCTSWEYGTKYYPTNDTASMTYKGEDNTPAATKLNDSPTAPVTAYKVTYSWTGQIPTGTDAPALPTDEQFYIKGQTYTVKNTQTTIETKDEYGNVTGRYTFSGWTDPNNGTMGAGDVKITGEWTYTPVKVEKHSVTYEWSGDKIPEGQTLPDAITDLVKGQPYTVDTTYTKDTVVETKDEYDNVTGRYTFSGWTDPNNGVMGEKDVTVTGEWKYKKVEVAKHTITINYVDEDGTTIKTAYNDTQSNGYNYSFDVSKDATGEIPFLITKENGEQYVFDSFAENSDALSGKLKDDVTITAQYLLDSDKDGTPDDYQATVTFKVENGTWSDDSTAPKTETFPLRKFNETTNSWDEIKPAPALGDKIPSGMKANEGYGNGAWSKPVPTNETKVTGNATYTYTFNKQAPVVTYTVTYDPNGGRGIMNDGNSPYAAGSEVTVLKNEFYRSHYRFLYWTTNKDGTGTRYHAGDKFTINANTTLYAQWRKTGGGGDVKPPVLDTKNHYGYIVGYTDDTVRPNGDVTRAEVATIFFRLLTDESRDQYWSQTNGFSDVAADQWYNNAVSTLTNAGILDGYEDGTFRPNGKITRAEFATIAVRFLDLSYEGKDLFPDIANHWAREYINQAASASFVNGYEDDTFRPDNPITRAEAVTLVNRTLERKPHKHHMLDDMKKWSDNMDPTVWYYEAIQEATNSHEYYMEKNDQGVEYEVWTKILPMRDWPALEKEWSQSNGGK